MNRVGEFGAKTVSGAALAVMASIVMQHEIHPVAASEIAACANVLPDVDLHRQSVIPETCKANFAGWFNEHSHKIIQQDDSVSKTIQQANTYDWPSRAKFTAEATSQKQRFKQANYYDVPAATVFLPFLAVFVYRNSPGSRRVRRNHRERALATAA